MSRLSPSEKKGILILLGILLIGFIFQWSQPYFVKNDLYNYSVQDSIFKSASADTSQINKNIQTGKDSHAEKRKKQTKSKGLDANSININTAGLAELEKLPRIGPAIAKNIIDYREKNGSFEKFEDLLKVKRIGAKTLSLIKPYIKLKDKDK